LRIENKAEGQLEHDLRIEKQAELQRLGLQHHQKIIEAQVEKDRGWQPIEPSAMELKQIQKLQCQLNQQDRQILELQRHLQHQKASHDQILTLKNSEIEKLNSQLKTLQTKIEGSRDQTLGSVVVKVERDVKME
jgi:uncharacterized FlaG/YvyC family protein